MQEELVSFQTAKLAKEKGFDEPCWEAYGVYSQFGDLKGDDCLQTSFENEFGGTFDEQDYDRECFYLAPTQSLLQKWLREVHNIHIEVLLSENPPYNEFYIRIMNIGKYFPLSHEGIYSKNYEEALEVGLITALELIKED